MTPIDVARRFTYASIVGFSPPPFGPGIIFTGSDTVGQFPQALFVIQPDGSGYLRLTDPGLPDRQVDNGAWSPDASKIAVCRTGNTTASLIVLYADGSPPLTIFTGAGAAWPDGTPGWTPDGSQVVCGYDTGGPENEDGAGFIFANADGSGYSLLPMTIPDIGGHTLGQIADFYNVAGVKVSPDGTKLGFTVLYNGGGGFPLYPAYCNTDGSSLVVLNGVVTSPWVEAIAGDWVDNSHLLVERDVGSEGGGSEGQLLSVDLSGGVSVLYDIATLGGGATLGSMSPSLSPDGSEIVFIYFVDRLYAQLGTVTISGGVVTLVHTGGPPSFQFMNVPDWGYAPPAPDGPPIVT